MKTDLFNNQEEMPPVLLELVEEFQYKDATTGLNYNDCREFQARAEKIGFTFEWGLDAEPYNLKPLGFA